MFAQWLMTAVTVAGFAACLYMWSQAGLLPERWHRLFRLGFWGAMVGAPVAAGVQLGLHVRWDEAWSDLTHVGGPAQRLGLYAGALAGSTVALRVARIDWRNAMQMAFTCLAPYALGLALASHLAGYTYSFFMLDAWDAPVAYREHVQSYLAIGYTAIAILGTAVLNFLFVGRVWRLWGATLPEDLGLAAWDALDLEPEPEEREARV